MDPKGSKGRVRDDDGSMVRVNSGRDAPDRDGFALSDDVTNTIEWFMTYYS